MTTLAKFYLKLLKTQFSSNLSFIQLMEEFDFRGHQCKYLKTTGEYFELDEKYDFIFVCSSIVCFETEIKICKKAFKKF